MAPTSAPEFSYRTRQHFWDHIKNNPTTIYNVVIIGGGIVGAGLLRELGLQSIPLSILFEKNDFASATSGKSSKLIHAGIRYLELSWSALKKLNFVKALRDFKFVWKASLERKILTRIAPQIIKPKPIHLVLGIKDKRWPASVFVGAWVYFLIQLIQGQVFTTPKFAYQKKAIEKLCPELDSAQVKAVIQFWDSETDDARLVIENLQNAHDHGCYTLNYVEMMSYRKEEDFVYVMLRNKENGQEQTIKTKVLVNATGPFVDDTIKREQNRTGKTKKLIDRVSGIHLDVYPKLADKSFYITAGDGRLVFLLNRHEDGLEYSRVGTTERNLDVPHDQGDPTATTSEIDYLKNLINEFFPNRPISGGDLMRIDWAIRPLRNQKVRDDYHKSREHAIVKEGRVFHIVGVKLTDYRRAASEILHKLPWKKLHLKLTEPKRSEYNTLRKNGNARLYSEDNVVEMARRTMVVHWDDYVNRRRGLGPRVLSKENPKAYEHEFDNLALVMGWDKTAQNQEKSRVSSD